MFHLNIHKNFITFKIISGFDFLSWQESMGMQDHFQKIRANHKFNELLIAKLFQK